MKRGLVLFGYEKPNRYSWSILMGFMEKFPQIMANYDFHALSFHLYQAPLYPEKLKEIKFEKYEYLILAYSLLSVQIPQFTRFMKKYPEYYKKFHSRTVSIVGGVHATASPKFFSQFNIDFVVIGEGENAFYEFLEKLNIEKPDKIDVSELHGVTRTYPHFDKGIPSKKVKLGAYPPFSEKFRFFGPIEISRGCPFRCKFCQIGNTTPKMRHAPLSSILNWIKRASEIKYDKVWFLSPNAFGYGSKDGVTPNIERLKGLLEGIRIKIPKIKKVYFGTFPSEVRPESVTREVLENIIPFIDNNKIIIGAQTASNRLLKLIRRGHTFEDVLQAIQLLKEFNLNVELDFIFGLPGETIDDMNLTLNFFKDILKGTYPNVRIHTHTFMPLPGTPFEKEPLGQVSPDIERIVGKLAAKGKAYGEYQTQAKIVKNKFTL